MFIQKNCHTRERNVPSATMFPKVSGTPPVKPLLYNHIDSEKERSSVSVRYLNHHGVLSIEHYRNLLIAVRSPMDAGSGPVKPLDESPRLSALMIKHQSE